MGEAAACASLLLPAPLPDVLGEYSNCLLDSGLGPKGGLRGRAHPHDPETGRESRDTAQVLS